MLISQQLSWPSVNWPARTPATQYTVYQIYPTPVVEVSTVNTTSAQLSFDDAVSRAYQVRPSSGVSPSFTVGPEVLVFVNGYVPCRGWLRQKVRKTLADRADASTNTQLNWPDDEINQYVEEALGELNVTFPVERNASISLLPPSIDTHGHPAGTRNYDLPTDFLSMSLVEYVSPNGNLHMFLKEKPWKGGETTVTSYIGYPKLGILMSPLSGRYFPGHYEIFEQQVQLDWDPVGDQDYLNIKYLGRRALPATDGDLLECTLEDMELLSLYVQMKCWLRVEVQDARLSRWRGNPEGSNRDGLPTVVHWKEIKKLYDQRVNDRRETRPRVRRLVRR